MLRDTQRWHVIGAPGCLVLIFGLLVFSFCNGALANADEEAATNEDATLSLRLIGPQLNSPGRHHQPLPPVLQDEAFDGSIVGEFADQFPEKADAKPTASRIGEVAAANKSPAGHAAESDERTNPPERAGKPASSPARHPSSAAEPLSPRMRQLRDRIRHTLATYHQNWILDARENTPWEIMHGIIAFGVHTPLYSNGPRGKKVSAIGWLCFNGPCKKIEMLSLDKGQLRVKKGPYVQGHYGQFLAMLAQSRLVTSYPLRVDGQPFTVADLIESEKVTCEANSELTFKLIALSHYLHTDDTWVNERGEDWSIPRLIAEELKQPILHTAACGGTHRLMGFSYAINRRRKEGRPIDGQFARAEKYTRDFRDYTFKLQNSDGSFSTKWFEHREAQKDRDRRMKTSGHILEWVVYSVPENQLDDDRVVRAVRYLTDLLWTGRGHEWEIGPLGHALHALSIYESRRFDNQAARRRAELARRERDRRKAMRAERARQAASKSASKTNSPHASHANEAAKVAKRLAEGPSLAFPH